MKITDFVENISFRRICYVFCRVFKEEYMRIIKQLAILPTLAALAAAAVSCHDGADWLTPDTGRRIEVSINAPPPARLCAKTD